jgi:hypothetical protein
MTKQPTLGTNAPLDVASLIESKMLVQANSGGGKSFAIRRICEQTYSFAPQIIFDVEGEFHTLREKYDYILAAPKGGDCVADIRSAALLMRRVLELGVSVIIDIYELGTQRGLFIKRALEALINSPRDLWRSLVVVVDEIHKFAPEGERCESTSAVIDLFTLGRKRGFCGIGATQRISKVHKDLAAECNNKLIGRCVLDIDIKRAANELGFTSREDAQSLKNLEPGEFYAFGPALANGVNKIKIGSVKTTHPKSGARALAPTPPSDHIRKILGKLDNLPREAEEELRTAEELRTKIKKLEIELRKKPSAVVGGIIGREVKIETKIIEKAVIKEAELKRIEKFLTGMQALGDRVEKVNAAAIEKIEAINGTLDDQFTDVVEILREISRRMESNSDKTKTPTVHTNGHTGRANSHTSGAVRQAASPSVDKTMHDMQENEALAGPEKKILEAIAWMNGIGQEAPALEAVAFIAGYTSTSGSFLNSRSKLRVKGLVEYPSPGTLRLTDVGLREAPTIRVAPSREELHQKVLDKLGGPERKLLSALINVHPTALSLEDLSVITGYEPTSGSFLNSRSRLRTFGLVDYPSSGHVRAANLLFP